MLNSLSSECNFNCHIQHSYPVSHSTLVSNSSPTRLILRSSVITIYFALVVDWATHCWNLDCYETTSPVKIGKYHDKDFLELTSPTISTSVYTCNTCLSPSKHKHVLEVPLRYLRIHFTVVQCLLRDWREINWLHQLHNDISLVQTMAYIKLLAAKTQGTPFISCLSFSLIGQYLKLSLKWLVSGEQTYFSLPMLNFSRTFSTYAFWDNHNFPDFLSWEIFLQIINLTSILADNQYVIHIKEKNEKIIIIKLLHENTIVTHNLAETMILYERIKFLVPLS